MDLLEFVPPEMEHDTEFLEALVDYEFALLQVHVLKIMQTRQRRVVKPKRRSVWVRSYLTRREEFGNYHHLMSELAGENPLLYRNFTRMPEELFNHIVERVTPYIQKRTTFWRKPLESGLCVAITLRFLATGDSYPSLVYSFRVAHNTISKIVPETCRAIVASFVGEVMKVPQSPQEWKEVAHGFCDRWNFPHTIGAIDGKHIRIQNSALSGSLYSNYKR